MSNTFTAIVNLCRDPEAITFGERECQKLRLADNTGSKNDARFFGAIVSGYDAQTAAKLRSGDQIVITGQLAATSYKAKKAGKNVKKGDTIKSDEMPFAKIMQVIKSPTFFGDDEAAPADDEADTSAPDLSGVPDTEDDPLADV